MTADPVRRLGTRWRSTSEQLDAPSLPYNAAAPIATLPTRPYGTRNDSPLPSHPRPRPQARYLQGMMKPKLLREDMLPSMALNQKVQWLLNEFMDLLSEYEAAKSKIEPIHATQALQPVLGAHDTGHLVAAPVCLLATY